MAWMTPTGYYRIQKTDELRVSESSTGPDRSCGRAVGDP